MTDLEKHKNIIIEAVRKSGDLMLDKFDFFSQDWTIHKRDILASNSLVHDELLAILRDV